MNYIVRIEDAKLGKTKIDAEDIEQAEERARRWVLEGDWSRWGREEFVAFTIEDENGVEWLYDQAVGGFAEPDCADGRAHVWKSPHELVGGGKSCPDTFRHGDIQYRFEEVCRHCGRYRTTISAGGVFLEARSTYRKPDEKSLAWLNQIAQCRAVAARMPSAEPASPRSRRSPLDAAPAGGLNPRGI